MEQAAKKEVTIFRVGVGSRLLQKKEVTSKGLQSNSTLKIVFVAACSTMIVCYDIQPYVSLSKAFTSSQSTPLHK